MTRNFRTEPVDVSVEQIREWEREVFAEITSLEAIVKAAARANKVVPSVERQIDALTETYIRFGDMQDELLVAA